MTTGRTGVISIPSVRKSVRKTLSMEVRMRRFYLYRRNQKNKIYYAQIINPLTGQKMPAKSTGCTDKDEAHFTVMSWLKDGVIPSGNMKKPRKADDMFIVDDIVYRIKNAPLIDDDTEKIIEALKDKGLIAGASLPNSNQPKLIDFLLDFWTWEISPYVAEKKAYNQSIGQSHVNENRKRIENYWKPVFDESLLLSDLTREMMREFSIHISKQHKRSRDKEKRELPELLSPITCNTIMKAGTVALNWAYTNKMIDDNPAAGIMKFGVKIKKRGILSDAEMKKLFKSGDWSKNEGARLACLLASQTGLRVGEVIALRVRDIDKDRLQINHSYSKVDGLKSPKNGETRQVPVLTETRKLILDYVKTNPFGYQPDSFIFYQADNADMPMRAETISQRFRVAVDSVIGEKERKARNIVFHGLRHYYVKKMSIALDKRAMMLSGHKSEAVFEHYADHATEEDFKKAADATAEVFGRVLNFPQKKAQ